MDKTEINKFKKKSYEEVIIEPQAGSLKTFRKMNKPLADTISNSQPPSFPRDRPRRLGSRVHWTRRREDLSSRQGPLTHHPHLFFHWRRRQGRCPQMSTEIHGGDLGLSRE